MIEKVAKQLKADGFKPNNKLLLAASAGGDSTALLYVLKALKVDFEVAHVNYQLRGEESNEDQEFIVKLCKKLSLKIHLKIVSKEEREQYSGSVQMQSRSIRYLWFNDLMNSEGFDYLCTAHHLNDSLETLLINWTRGTSIKGMLGISSSKKILRPFQQIEKNEILNFLIENSIVFRNDSTNALDKYQRNWFRHHIVNPWIEEHRDLMQQSKKNFESLQEVFEVFKKAVKKDSKKIREELEKGNLRYAAIKALDYPKQSLVSAIKKYGFNADQADNILSNYSKPSIGAKIEAPNYDLIFDRNQLFLNTRENNDTEKILYLQDEDASVGEPLKLKTSTHEVGSIEDYLNDKKAYLFDLDKLSFPLEVRKWRHGDKIKPKGLNGKKKVSDILIDQKVPLHQKEQVYVLEQSGKILSVLGYKRSNHALISDQTKSVFKLELK